MGNEARKLLEAALALPKSERADLAEKLIASVDAEGPTPSDGTEADREVEQAWADEIVRRVERIERGEATGSPFEEVKARMLARFGSR
jgi:putative addiction module component (TIGR02574 family)